MPWRSAGIRVLDDDPDAVDERGAQLGRLDALRRELGGRRHEPDPPDIDLARHRVGRHLDAGARRRASEMRLVDIGANPDGVDQRYGEHRRVRRHDGTRLADPRQHDPGIRRLERRALEPVALGGEVRAARLDLGRAACVICSSRVPSRRSPRSDSACRSWASPVRFSHSRGVERLLRGDVPPRQLLGALEVLGRVLERRLGRRHRRPGLLDLEPPRAGEEFAEPRIGAPQHRGGIGFGVVERRLVENGEGLPGFDAVALVDQHMRERPVDPEGEVDLPYLDVAVEEQHACARRSRLLLRPPEGAAGEQCQNAQD